MRLDVGVAKNLSFRCLGLLARRPCSWRNALARLWRHCKWWTGTRMQFQSPLSARASQFTLVRLMRSTGSSTWQTAASMLQKNEVEIRLSPSSVTGKKFVQTKKHEQVINLLCCLIQRLTEARDRSFNRIIINLVMCDESKATIIFRIHQYPKFSHPFPDLL